MSEPTAKNVLDCRRNVAVIGAGVIGASWTALFLSHGLHVVVNDPRPDAESAVKAELKGIAPVLAALGLPHDDLAKNLRFEPDLERAVESVDVVQENGPERIEFKQELWERIERRVSADVLLLSSSSARTATEQALRMKTRASRLLIGHPFNPPHLIPLVEIVPGATTDPEAVTEAVAFYRALGKTPLVLRKEIPGFVANRLQRALFRECFHLVSEGVVTVDELDDVVTSSIGLRWAADGPFRSFHLGGGPGGFPAFFKQFGASMDAAWNKQATVHLDKAAQDLVIAQANASFAATPYEQLEAERAAKQIAILRALEAVKAG